MENCEPQGIPSLVVIGVGMELKAAAEKKPSIRPDAR